MSDDMWDEQPKKVKRVLLTGIGGSIGVHVYAHIMEHTDWYVVGLDSFRHKGYKDRITEITKGKPEWVERLKIIEHDLVCPISPDMKDEIGDINHILHLAAMSDVYLSIKNPMYVIRNNVESTLTMIDYASAVKHDTFVYFSTDEVYGATTKDGAHKEWDSHRPSNPYSASKAMSEDACYQAWRSGLIKYINTNTMNNFAEMQSAAKYPVMIQKALENGDTIEVHGSTDQIGTRYYIHSTDTADALLFILNNLPPHLHQEGEIDDPDRYHIVGDVQLDNLELAQRIAKLMGKPLKYTLKDFHKDNPAHDIHYGLQDNKLRKAGWKQLKTFDERMKQTIDWQYKHKEWV
jgi:dTDP-D-glucose 4,6-dehydratase